MLQKGDGKIDERPIMDDQSEMGSIKAGIRWIFIGMETGLFST